jgi:heterodisulfide reductase subunit C
LGLEGFESDDILYACTTCKLCVVNCPRQVNIIDVVRAMRAMIAESGAARQSLRTIMGSIHSQGNPWSEPGTSARPGPRAWTCPASRKAPNTS